MCMWQRGHCLFTTMQGYWVALLILTCLAWDTILFHMVLQHSRRNGLRNRKQMPCSLYSGWRRSLWQVLSLYWTLLNEKSGDLERARKRQNGRIKHFVIAQEKTNTHKKHYEKKLIENGPYLRRAVIQRQVRLGGPLPDLPSFFHITRIIGTVNLLRSRGHG